LILHRCFPLHERARTRSEGGPLWFPRLHQGGGRHDNPDEYGCLYVTDREESAVVERLAPVRGSLFLPAMLVQEGQPLALAAIELPDDRELIDLDEPRVLAREGLRPSLVATGMREVTQPQALMLHRGHADAAGLRWWSIQEASWINVTLFDRARTSLRLVEVRALTPDDPAVMAATDFLGMSA
jgi:hypothetical protein